MRDYGQEGPLAMPDAAAGRDERMRVGVFAHRLSQRHPTGIGRYIQELVCALAELTDQRSDFVVASTREPKAAGWVPNAVETRVLPWPRRPVQTTWCLGLGPRLERSVGHLDVVHLMQPFPPVKTDAPQLVTVHDLFPLEHPGWYRRSERWTYRRSMTLLLERAERIVVPSEYVANRLTAMLDVPPTQIEVIPLGVSGVFGRGLAQEAIDAACARFAVAPGSYAVCVGGVSTRKNLVPLVRAFAHLPGDERIPLVMIGPDGHGVGAVDAEIAKLDGGAQVTRTGFLHDSEAAALVGGAAVLVHPALGEGFGFVPLEAMTLGTPVIAAAVSSIPEVAGEAAILVDAPSEPAAWASALSRLLRDPKKRAAMTSSGQQRAAKFSWQRSARRLLDVYAEVAGN
jgi:glycosyltransferase involved in cell wall biosynthesis